MAPSIKTEKTLPWIANRRITTALRLRFLTPLVAAIVVLTIMLTISLFYFESERQSYSMIHERLVRTQSVTKDFFERRVVSDVKAITAIMTAMRLDAKLDEVFASYNREALLDYTVNLFQGLRREYNITHLYFTKPDRVNLLRVHAPERFGDKIDRLTTLQAVKKNDIAYGVELGVLGTFTLRVVSPWYDRRTGKLIGYVELGMEIDHVIEQIRESLDLKAAVVVYKEYLQRKGWGEGMAMLGRTDDWDEFSDFVLSSDSPAEIPAIMREYLKQGLYLPRNELTKLERDGVFYWLLSVPIEDVMGHDVAAMVLLTDVTSEADITSKSALVIGAAVFFMGGLLIAFFYWQAGRIGRRIEHDEKILEDLATHDSLTGLYTRRVFHEYLDLELAHAARFDRPVSLLLLDIDHFKRVNDTFGHQVGDMILIDVARRIRKTAREVDHVCRYGGEEIAIILPETDANGAREFANRVKNKVTAYSYNIDNRRSHSLTVSIGISSYPADADADADLISAADSALYAAKEGGRDQIKAYAPAS